MRSCVKSRGSAGSPRLRSVSGLGIYRETTATSQCCMSETPWQLVYAYMYYRRYSPSVRVSRADIEIEADVDTRDDCSQIGMNVAARIISNIQRCQVCINRPIASYYCGIAGLQSWDSLVVMSFYFKPLIMSRCILRSLYCTVRDRIKSGGPLDAS